MPAYLRHPVIAHEHGRKEGAWRFLTFAPATTLIAQQAQCEVTYGKKEHERLLNNNVGGCKKPRFAGGRLE